MVLQAHVVAPFPISPIIANDRIPKNIDRHSTLFHHEMLHLIIVTPWRRLFVLILRARQVLILYHPAVVSPDWKPWKLGMAKDFNKQEKLVNIHQRAKQSTSHSHQRYSLLLRQIHQLLLSLFPPVNMYGLETHMSGLSLFPQAHLFGLETHLIGPLVGFLFGLQLSDLCQPEHAVVDVPSF